MEKNWRISFGGATSDCDFSSVVVSPDKTAAAVKGWTHKSKQKLVFRYS